MKLWLSALLAVGLVGVTSSSPAQRDADEKELDNMLRKLTDMLSHQENDKVQKKADDDEDESAVADEMKRTLDELDSMEKKEAEYQVQRRGFWDRLRAWKKKMKCLPCKIKVFCKHKDYCRDCPNRHSQCKKD